MWEPYIHNWYMTCAVLGSSRKQDTNFTYNVLSKLLEWNRSINSSISNSSSRIYTYFTKVLQFCIIWSEMYVVRKNGSWIETVQLYT
jgi:hypothetical protein